LKLCLWNVSAHSRGSPPARGRGLKHCPVRHRRLYYQSPPARGRGLKLVKEILRNDEEIVAPRAGAWIETRGSRPTRNAHARRPPRGGVD